MNYRSYTLLIVLFCISIIAHGQREKGRINAQLGAGGFVETLPLKKGETKGDYYMNDDWYEGTIVVNGVHIVNKKPLKIDLLDNSVDVKYDDGVRFMYLNGIDTIMWIDPLKESKTIFINSVKYGKTNPPIFEVLLQTKKVQLFAHTSTRVIKANYNPALDVGEKADRIMKERTLFYSLNGNNISAVPSSKKTFVSIFSNKEEVKKFIKNNGLNLNEEADVIEIFNQYQAN